MPIALSSWCRGDLSPSGFCDLARQLGVSGLALDARLPEGYRAELAGELQHRSYPLLVYALEPSQTARVGSRAPQLASPDRDELAAAVRLATATVSVASDLGARFVTLRLGAFEAEKEWRRVVTAFARREALRRASAIRSGALDAARFALDPLLHVAERADVTLCLVNRARFFEIPSESEIATLLDDFRGAPLSLCIDLAALYVKERLGQEPMSEFLARHSSQARATYVSDACGLQGGIPWGQGEMDPTVLNELYQGHPDILSVANFAPGLTSLELAAGLAWIARP